MTEPIDPPEFQRIVDETVRTLPPQFQEAIKDVAIVIEERPRNRQSRTLLGLYEGIPVTAWGRGMVSGKMPDKISLFKENIESYAFSPEEIPHIIRETLLHEIAHHFGFDHDKIHHMEKRWKAQRKDSSAE